MYLLGNKVELSDTAEVVLDLVYNILISLNSMHVFGLIMNLVNLARFIMTHDDKEEIPSVSLILNTLFSMIAGVMVIGFLEFELIEFPGSIIVAGSVILLTPLVEDLTSKE